MNLKEQEHIEAARQCRNIGDEWVSPSGITFRRVAERRVIGETLSSDERGLRSQIDEGVRIVSGEYPENALDLSYEEPVAGTLVARFNALSSQQQDAILWEIDPYDGCFGDIMSLNNPEKALEGRIK